MPLLLTFGDSNTYGTPPIEVEGVSRPRYAPDVRWPGVCLAALGEGWSLVEEGLPGRTTARPCADMGPHMDGRVGLAIALQSHGPIDVLTICLGTNDTKSQFEARPEEIAADAGFLLDMALSDEMQERHGGFDVLLICPPLILEQGPIAPLFVGGAARSAALPALYRAEAEARGVDFLDLNGIAQSSPVDGIHFEPETHAAIGKAVAAAIQEMLAEE